MIQPFPRIPHFPGSNAGPDDLVLEASEARIYYETKAIVLEKLDGINVAIGRGRRGTLSASLRGVWSRESRARLTRTIGIYLELHRAELGALLGPHDTLYGEWLYHRLSVPYDRLEDDFVGIALRSHGELIPAEEAMARIEGAGLTPNRPVFRGRLRNPSHLRSLVGQSRFGRTRMEGLIVEIDHERRWAKWVDAAYRKHPRGRVPEEKNEVLGANANRASQSRSPPNTRNS
ncbi:MAG: hypothetical protein HYV07_13705 [Deltaproteobacteria bacterium]|nr:hypothetical protein [Deltaproteobacteria bacterium]